MSAGRKPNKAVAVEVIDSTLDQPKIANAMVQMRADGVAERHARDTDMFDLGRQVGAIQMANVQTDFVAVARIRLFDEIQNSNKYKDLAFIAADGSLRTTRTIEEFCQSVFGVGHPKMFEASKNLESLGQGAYESANRLGLNRKQLRLIRSLPDAQRTAVAEAIQAESKAEVVSIIEDLAAQLAQAHDDAAEQALEKEATEKIVANLHKQNDKLSRHLAKLTPDQKLAELQKEATGWMRDARGAVCGQLRQALIAVRDHDPDQDHSIFMAGLVGQVQADVAALREEFHLPDVSTAAELELAAEVAQWALPAKK